MLQSCVLLGQSLLLGRDSSLMSLSPGGGGAASAGQMRGWFAPNAGTKLELEHVLQ